MCPTNLCVPEDDATETVGGLMMLFELVLGPLELPLPAPLPPAPLLLPGVGVFFTVGG